MNTLVPRAVFGQVSAKERPAHDPASPQTSPKTASAPPANVVPRVNIESIPVDAFADLDALLDRMVADIRKPGRPALIFSINIHGANMAHRDGRFRRIMQSADTMICDGMGTLLANRLNNRLLGHARIPCRLAAGDFMPALLRRLADEGLTAYFLAGEPGVAETALARLAQQVPDHTVVGTHHGYILKDKALEDRVIDEINRLKPDILFVGMGMPLQEFWIDGNRDRLAVGALFPFGATLDYLSRKVPRCPTWLGNLGLEWLFRLCLEPRRMFNRYVVGNPSFLSRVLAGAAMQRLTSPNKVPLNPASGV